MGQAGTISKIKVDHLIKEPPMFKVIYLNDNQTTVEFVIETLIEFFNYKTDTALQITKNITEQNSKIKI
jgi:ATP-dependent Clp protease adapter protein ClpS